MRTSLPAIDIHNLTIRFGDFVALDDVSLSIAEGVSTGVIGPNGAGKTTLFHALTGDLRGNTGVVKLNGMPVTNQAPDTMARLGLGKLFQDVRVFPNLTVRENLLVALHRNDQRAWHRAWISRLRTRGTVDQHERAEVILKRIGLDTIADVPAGSLSFGSQKTLAIGRLLAGGFSTFLLDEPMAGLSPQRADRMTTLIQEIVAEKKVTVLLIEHNMQHVRKLCGRTIVMNRGKVFADGPTLDVLMDSGVREICLGL